MKAVIFLVVYILGAILGTYCGLKIVERINPPAYENILHKAGF